MEEINYEKQMLLDYEIDMQDDYKSWKEAEKELEDAKKWLEKMIYNYAESTVRYYQLKNKNNETL